MAPTGFEVDEIDDAGADAPTTVQPPIFVSAEPGEAPTIRAMPPPPAPMAMAPMPMAMVPRPQTYAGLQALYGKPPWLRYLVVALGLAIPLAIGFGSRGCGSDDAVTTRSP